MSQAGRGTKARRLWWLSASIAIALATACSGSIGDGDSDLSVADAGDAGDGDVDDAAIGDASEPADAWIVPVPEPVKPPSDPKPDAGPPKERTGCGDGKLQSGESCDDGNSAPGDGCSADCLHVEQDFLCPAPGQRCVSTEKCGDGRIMGREQCDDGNRHTGDGCDGNCELEAGYTCPTPGAVCVAKCGDRMVLGDEQCEDDDETPADGDGCSAHCTVEAGYVCPTPGEACVATICNDGKREGSEACDDGNAVVGDGCTPFCEVEPDCRSGVCASRCGDGVVLPNDPEACDDGNGVDRDGCSSKCEVESGYACTLEKSALTDTLSVPVTYRDFISVPIGNGVRAPDFEAFTGADATYGLVMSMLGSDGKPQYAGICDDSAQPFPAEPPGTGMCPFNQQMTTAANFEPWYRDVPDVNVTKVARMSLARDDATGAYTFRSAEFFPWDGDSNSWVGRNRENLLNGHNYGFTTEIRTYFEYDPANPQTLTFLGDDDVWVFINRKLAVDIGGTHVESTRSVTLDEATANTLGLEAGHLYELALFHAERHIVDSHFNLTLQGFSAAKSRCEPKCGDGIVTATESCDDGKNDGSYGGCTSDCKRAAYCGDGKTDEPDEACDDGFNLTTYATGGKAGCAPGCNPSAFCGDKRIDSLAGEECDDGENKGGYGKCSSDCHLGARCGDGELQKSDGEECDDANRLGNDGCSADCKNEGPA